MPSFSKKALSLYLRTGCERQLKLNLYTGTERRERGMPPKQSQRAAVGLVGQKGYDWQAEKVAEVADVFGAEHVLVGEDQGKNRVASLPPEEWLTRLAPYQFVVEGAYVVDTPVFRRAVGLGEMRDQEGELLDLSEGRPDIVQTLPPLAGGLIPLDEKREEYQHAVGPSGLVARLADDDPRVRLRVIDIKQTSEPGAHYFAEVVYYSMTLAAYLEEEGLSEEYVVVAAPAVWPGSHEASHLSETFDAWRRRGHEPSAAELTEVLEEDLEIAPVDAFAARLTRLLREELPRILKTDWDELAWHVDYRCRGCDFLGYPWKNKDGDVQNDPSHCWPTAKEEGNLSQVAGLSRGGAGQLKERGAASEVHDLAHLNSADTVFDQHHGLRTKRTVYPSRAGALLSGEATVIPDSGGDALMPKWPNLWIYLFLDYDLASAITVCFALRAFWKEPIPYSRRQELDAQMNRWNAKHGFQEAFLVGRENIEREREELLKFLRALRGIMDEVRRFDREAQGAGRRDKADGTLDDKVAHSTYQIFLWDEAQKKHLTRLVSRHLPAILADPDLRDLAWLFPPAELLARSEAAARPSPLTLVADVVRNTVAASVPHHYTLLEVVQRYKPEGLSAPSTHPLYREPLSDLVPGERVHEFWAQKGDWMQTGNLLRETTQKKLSALGIVTSKLNRDLYDRLSRLAAPPLSAPPRRPQGLSPHGRLWHEFTRLNASLQKLEAYTVQAMPVHEREARFKSAVLEERLEGEARADALEKLRASAQRSLQPSDELFIYRLRPSSVDLNARDGAIGYVLSPAGNPSFLEQHPFPTFLSELSKKDRKHVGGLPRASTVADSGLTGVSIETIDRGAGLVALRPGTFNGIRALENLGLVDLRRDVVLDPTAIDALTKKVKLTLQGIGHPPSAHADERVLEALGEQRAAPGTGAETPASRLLWQTQAVAGEEVARDAGVAQEALRAAGFDLNESQWDAFAAALMRRFTLIWGPPGTGKSRTLRMVVLGALLDAAESGQPLRVLVTAHTYNAVDNVLRGMSEALRPSEPLHDRLSDVAIRRLQSTYRSTSDWLADVPNGANIPFYKKRAPQEIRDLQGMLDAGDQTVVVGAPAQQVYNLAVARPRSAAERPNVMVKNWFDLVVLDEASQLDVATSTLALSKAATGGSVVLAGDNFQLPPIHQAEPPEDLEHVVGSVYDYFRHHMEIEPQPLNVNYRSNATLVDFVRTAGYDPALKAYAPDLKLHFVQDLPSERPTDWPASLYWTADWSRLLDPERAAVSFVYEDLLSSQVNAFEADAVTALLWLLRGRLSNRLLCERRPDGSFYPPSNMPYAPEGFWQEAVGVVTPHRAQMSKIVGQLQQLFPEDPPPALRSAVDTVERFQGQQRDIIIASFGLGDPDLIAQEDEFLYSLNRFNVLASRARAKLIVLAPHTLVDHLSDDADVLNESRLLKRYVEQFCNERETLRLGHLREGGIEEKAGELRWHEGNATM